MTAIALSAPRMRSGAAQGGVQAPGELEKLAAPLGHRRRRLGERLTATRADLHLGGDQLPDELALEVRPYSAISEFREAGDEAVRAGVEDRELLLDRKSTRLNS